jgi:endonuclease YncB( thermonuclease family)
LKNAWIKQQEIFSRISGRIILKNKVLVLFLFPILTGTVFLFFLASCGLFYYDDFKSGVEIDDSPETANSAVDIFYVDEVIDGDTFLLTSGETVRMLGINTPEIDRYYYSEAKEILDIMIGGKQVTLERDITDRDSYGRLLRYVYTGSLFVNLEMIIRGYANVYTLPPDVMHSEDLLEAERYARENKLGLWAETLNPYSIGLFLNFDAEGDDRENLNGEYLILRNEDTSDHNIKGWTVKDSGTSIYEFKRFVFSKGAEITLFTGNGRDGNGIFYWNSNMPVWNNDHDMIYLRDREGLLI